MENVAPDRIRLSAAAAQALAEQALGGIGYDAEEARMPRAGSRAIRPRCTRSAHRAAPNPLIIAAMPATFRKMRTRAVLCRDVAVLAVVMGLPACSDGATRIAFDIESGVTAFERSQAATATIRHVPEGMPEGCKGPYTLQLSARSSLVIWCKDATGAQTVASHATTYHLRFVDVPQTFRIDKAAGEATLIDIVRRDGKPAVTGVR